MKTVTRNQWIDLPQLGELGAATWLGQEMTMDGFRELQRLRPRQDASSGSVGTGESNTFLDLIANPFLAAVSFSSTQNY